MKLIFQHKYMYFDDTINFINEKGSFGIHYPYLGLNALFKAQYNTVITNINSSDITFLNEVTTNYASKNKKTTSKRKASKVRKNR